MTEDQKALLQTYLAEYASMRQELITRLQALNQAFNYLLVLIGATVTVIVAASEHAFIEEVGIVLALLLPILAAPLAFIFFDQEMTMDAIWSYTQESLRPRIVSLVGDEDILGNIWEFRYMHPSSWAIYHRLLIGRWLLFLVPTVLPLSYFFVYTAVNWGWWHNYSLWSSRADLYIILLFGNVVLAIDVLVTYHLVKTIRWTFRKWDLSHPHPAA